MHSLAIIMELAQFTTLEINMGICWCCALQTLASLFFDLPSFRRRAATLDSLNKP